MKISDAYERFRNYVNFGQPESLFDLQNLDTNFIDKALYGSLNRIHTDLLGQVICIGDIVSYGKIGGYKGLSVGVLLGFTDGGFRVARIHKDPGVEYFYCGDMQTPGQVTVIKGKR